MQFIDFHQLQIENKKYVKEVDEKNKLLLKLKMTIGKITQDKNNYKNRLTNELQKSMDNRREIKRNRQDKEKLRLMNIRQNKISEERHQETNMLHNKLTKGAKLLTNHHVREKNIEKELIPILDNLKKKLEIEEIKSKEVKRYYIK